MFIHRRGISCKRDFENPITSAKAGGSVSNMSGLQNIRPWAIAFYLWGIRGYNDLRGGFGVDNHIAFEAQRHHKACGALETNEQHVDVLRGMADIDAELILLDALVRGDKRKGDYNATRDGWKHGDLARMLADEKRERDLNLGAEIRLLDYRNLRWVPKICALIQSGVPTSIVVGTGHFWTEQCDRTSGKEGLQNLAIVAGLVIAVG